MKKRNYNIYCDKKSTMAVLLLKNKKYIKNLKILGRREGFVYWDIGNFLDGPVFVWDLLCI